MVCGVNLVAVVGADDFADAHVELLRAHGVDLAGLAREPGPTPVTCQPEPTVRPG